LAIRYVEFSNRSVMKDGSGPNVGGQLFFTESGGDTLKAIYNDSEEILANEIANPVILDSQGRIPAGLDVFLAGQYRLTIKEAPDSVTGLSIMVTFFDAIGGTSGGQFEDTALRKRASRRLK